jgi:hypothetical protein
MAKLGYTDAKMMGYSLRTNQYRYTIWMNNFNSKEAFNESQVYASEMYDYVKDPLEKVNVVKDIAYKITANDMHKKMLEFFKSQVK